MRRSSPSPEQGSAAVEVLVLGVLLLVPLVYLVLTVAALQGAAFAAEGAARQAARSIALAATDARGEAGRPTPRRPSRSPTGTSIPPRPSSRCGARPDPDDCGTPRGTVDVRVRVAATLPLLPPALAVGRARQRSRSRPGRCSGSRCSR